MLQVIAVLAALGTTLCTVNSPAYYLLWGVFFSSLIANLVTEAITDTIREATKVLRED